MQQLAFKEPVSVTWVTNILDPVATRKTMAIDAGATLGVALQKFVPLAPAGFEVTACLNGELLPIARHDILLLPGDNLVMAARPQGGGGGGSNPLAMVAMIAVIVVATIVTYGAAGVAAGSAWGAGSFATVGGFGLSAAGAAFAAVAGATVMGVGGYLVSTAFKNKLPDYGGGGQDALGSSPSYSWQTQPNPLAEGSTLPVLYGRFMITPPLVARHVDSSGKQQHLNLLYALAGHRIDAVEEVIINDQPYTAYKNTVLDVRLGDPDQAVVPYFGDLKEEVNIQAKLSTDWTTREFPGTLQGFAVGLGYRLYYANDKGGMNWVSANIMMQYRKKGTTAWTVHYNIVREMHWFERDDGYWSYGYWSSSNSDYGSSRYWRELVRGHSNKGTMPPVPDKYNNRWNYRYAWRWVAKIVKYQAPVDVPYDYFTISGNDPNMLRHVTRIDNVSEGQYEVRVRLRSALNEGSRYGSDVIWDFCHLIQYDDFTYPCTALGGIRALATDQISSGQPIVKFLARRDKVWIFNADARRYEEKSARNPAWACYDALHNGAPGHPDPACYGLAVAHTKIVYADFFDWAQWCDKKGHTVDLYIESPLNGKAGLDMLGLMGRGSVIQIGSRFTCTVDKPRELPRQTFLVGMGNIASQTFTKEWLPMQDRANVVELTYFDEEAQYQRQTVEIYQDGFDTSNRNIIKTQRTLYGCSTRQAALTFGRGLMLRNRYLTYMPSFETGVESIHCLPGDAVDLAIDSLQGGASGRVADADEGSITLDCLVPLYPGVQYALELQHIEDDLREYAYIVGVPQETETDVLTLLKPLSRVPAPGTKYAFGEVGRTKQTFTILDMKTASDQRKRLQLLEYVPEVYNDEFYQPDDEDWGTLPFVRNLRITEIWAPGGPDGSGKSVIGLTWRGNALYWNIWVREKDSGQNWNKVAQVTTPEYRIERGLVVGRTYQVSVSIGVAENGVQASITLRGKIAPPNDVQGFRAFVHGDEIRMTWEHIPDADLWAYEIRMGKTWDTGLTVLNGVTENTAAWGPPMDGTYRLWIKAIDESGLYSVNPAEALVTIDISGVLNVVWQREELPEGIPASTLELLAVTDNGKRLAWIPSLTDRDFPPETTDLHIGYYCGDTAPGVYTSQVYDLGTVTPFDIRLMADFTAIVPAATDLTYPSRTDMDYPADTDLSVSSLSVYRAEYCVSDDNETWSDWVVWTSSHEISGRYFQYRFTTVLDSVGVRFDFTRLSGLADVPDQETVFKASIEAEGTRFTIEEIGLRPMLMGFHVGVTILGSAALYPAVEEEAQAFTVRCFDALGNPHAANTSIEVRGF